MGSHEGLVKRATKEAQKRYPQGWRREERAAFVAGVVYGAESRKRDYDGRDKS